MRNLILLVDSASARRASMKEILEGRFTVLEAGTDEQMNLLLEQNRHQIALVLLEMERLDQSEGQILANLKKNPVSADIPVIVMTRSGDPDSECRALSWGADDTVLWPLYPDLVMKRILTIISMYRHQWNLEGIINEQQEALNHSGEVMTDVLSSLIEHRSIESGNHVLRIRRFTQILLEEVAQNCPEYRLNSRAIRMISGASALHDIGKIAIPDAILNKPDKLTDQEYEIMKTHVVEGCHIIEQLGALGDEEYLRYAYDICRYHHERWDGKGYPDGLAGDDIPLCAQVVGLADVYDALTAPRIYKQAYPHSMAVNMILMGECGQFSRKLIECFKCVRDKFDDLAKMYADGSIKPSARLSEPAPSIRRTNANTLQAVLQKYDLLLSYLDCIVIEIDRNQGLCHIVHNPATSRGAIREAANLAQTLDQAVLLDVHAEERSILTDQYGVYLDAFFESGLRRSEWKLRVRKKDGSSSFFQVTTLRIPTEGERRAFSIWKPVAAPEKWPAPRQDVWNLSSLRALGMAQVCRYDRDLTMEEADGELCALLGYSREELKAQFAGSFLQCILPKYRAQVVGELDRQLLQGHVAQAVFPLKGRKNAEVWVFAKCILEPARADGERIVFLLSDITGTEYVWKNQMLSSRDYQDLLEKSRDITFCWEMAADRIACSPRWQERFGYQPNFEQASRVLLHGSYFHPNDMSTLRSNIAALGAGAQFVEFMVRIVDSAGQYSWNCIRAAAQLNEKGKIERLIGVVNDMSDELLFLPVLQEQINRDPMTKLLDKETARRQVESYLAAGGGKLSAMAVIDLDNFKIVNDRYGHLFGDMILNQVAQQISSLFRSSDVVARVGGDEFLVFMMNIPRRELIEERCAALVQKVRELSGRETADCELACSVGVAFSPEHGLSYQELFQHADSALYQAKSSGKGCFRVYQPLAERTISPTMIGRIDASVPSESYGQGIMKYIFERMYESDDLDETIDSLLEFVGRQVQARRVYIFENNVENTRCSNTYEWVAEGVRPAIGQYQNLSYEMDIPGYESHFDEQDIFHCPDTRQLPEKIRKVTALSGDYSMLQCAIRDRGVFRGFIGIDDHQFNRLWTNEHIEMLTILSKILSIFLIKKRVQEQESAMAGNLEQLLNSRDSYFYVIGAQDYILRFLNKKAKQLVGNRRGATCHKAFMNLDQPCENCPVRDERHEVIVENEFLNMKVKAAAHLINWKGNEQWLVNCKDILPEAPGENRDENPPPPIVMDELIALIKRG